MLQGDFVMKTNDEFCAQKNGYSVTKELSELTNLYSLSKTLRFELKPEPETKQRFEKWLNELKEVSDFSEAIKNGNLFAEDNAIYKAYIALKPILDSIHEQFINIALQSDEAQNIDFSSYFEKFRDSVDNDKKLIDEEKRLRSEIGKLYSIPASRFVVKKTESKSKGKKQEIIDEEDSEEETKSSKKKSEPYKILTDKSILTYIEENIGLFTKEIPETEIRKHLAVFKGFFTYFSGYNINRENYYATKDEKSTAVATRIVHENLPKFCNNILRYEKNQESYNQIYDELKKLNKQLIIKTPDGEKEAEPITNKLFKIDYFNSCLSQAQIEKYNSDIGNAKFLINLYNQAHSKDKKFNKIPTFETLHKQIGCGKKKSFIMALIKDDEADLTDEQKNRNEILSLEKMLSVISEKVASVFSGKSNQLEISTIQDYLCYLKNCSDWKGIYWNKIAVTSVSNRFFMNWYDIADKLKNIKSCATFDKKREEQFKLNDAVELEGLFSVLDEETVENSFKQSVLEEYKEIINLNESTSKNLIRILCSNVEKSVSYVLEYKNKVLETKRPQKSVNDSEKDNAYNSMVKDWLDSITDVFHFVKMFDVRENKVKGNMLNSEIKEAVSLFLYNDDTPWFKWYDAVRNYLTKKPQDDVKDSMLKLNFGKGNLLGGFRDSYSNTDNGTQYGGYIFRKFDSNTSEYEYYIGISKNAKLFRCHLKDSVLDDDKSEFERMDYCQLKSNTPYPTNYGELKNELIELIDEKFELFIKNNPESEQYSKKIKSEITKSDPIPKSVLEEIEKSAVFKSILEDDDIVEKVNQIIKDIQSRCCKTLTYVPDMVLLSQREYKDVSGYINIIDDIADIVKRFRDLSFFNVSKKEFEQHNGKDLFLFQISNKDLSYCRTVRENKRKRKSNEESEKHNENLHTLFFRALMKEYSDCLNIDIGKGAIFLREPSYHYSEEVLRKGHHYEMLKDKFSYPIISNKRFSERKFLFHLSVTLNYSSKTYKEPKYGFSEVNTKVNDVIQQSEEIKYLGVDRGEKNLIYTCVVDKNGKIIDCSDQNTVNHTDYNQKLSEVAANRLQARKNWHTIENISNLKEGYLSNVIHKIVTQTIKEPTYIVLEDLNVPMMQSRQKVEKQVYQKFEVALAKKLNFVVDKNAKENQLASVGKALQLTPPISNYQDIESKKQFGVMLYTRANYTSVTDPVTGWRKTVYLKKGSEEDTKKAILESFSEIAFDGKDYYFEYTEKHAGKIWRLYSGKNGESLPRFQNNKKLENDKAVWRPEAVDLVCLLNELFADFDKTKSLRDQIENNEHSLRKISTRKETAWDSLRYVIDTIQHIRNTGKTEKDSNFLYSPVRDENGVHFDTREHDNTDLPADADANGAYNIARKGIIMDAHIKQWINDGKKVSDLDLFISDEEWDLWLLNKDKWNEKLSFFASYSAKKKEEKEKTKKTNKSRKSKK